MLQRQRDTAGGDGGDGADGGDGSDSGDDGDGAAYVILASGTVPAL